MLSASIWAPWTIFSSLWFARPKSVSALRGITSKSFGEKGVSGETLQIPLSEKTPGKFKNAFESSDLKKIHERLKISLVLQSFVFLDYQLVS